MGADEQVCSRPAHPAPTSRTEPPKVQRKGTKEKEKANKRNLRKKKQSKPREDWKREAGAQSANLQKTSSQEAARTACKNIWRKWHYQSRIEWLDWSTQPYPVALLVQHLVAQLIYTALSSGSTDPASSGSTDLHSTIQWLYWSSIQWLNWST